MPLLAVAGARTSRIEVGTGVIDKRYESPLHLAEEIVALDLLTDRASSSVSPAAPRSRRCRQDRSRPGGASLAASGGADPSLSRDR